MSDQENLDVQGAKPDELRKNVFRVPDGYFELLPSTISARISNPVIDKRVSSPWPLRLALASMVCLVVVTGMWYVSHHRKTEESVPQLTYEDLVSSGTWYDLDEQLLVDELPSEAIDTLPAGGYDDYLIEQDTDINLIINEL